MKIYKVCGNYLKGVQEFEIKKINPDNGLAVGVRCRLWNTEL